MPASPLAPGQLVVCNNSHLEELPLKIPSERLIGFTAPARGRFFVCDHDEVWMVDLKDKAELVEIDDAPYKFVEGRSDFVGWGLNDKEVKEVGDTGIQYEFHPSRDFVVVHYWIGAKSGEINFRISSGDWFAASLSDDGKFLVLAEPYALAIFAMGRSA